MKGRWGWTSTRGARTGGLLLALLLLGALAIPGQATAAKRPFVYIFSLDGLDRDAVIGEGSAPFLSSVIDDEDGARSSLFPRSRSVMVSETNPNHTSMITGAYPKGHGIVGNEFATYPGSADEQSCPARTRPNAMPGVVTGQSPSCLQAETAYESIERQAPDRSRTTALIMGKPKLARLYATKSGGEYDADHIWAPCDEDEPYCEDVPTNPGTGYAADDSIVMDEVIRTTREKVRDAGTRSRPDLTFVNFPQIDSAGHATGRTSAAYSTAVGMADSEISRFVANQKDLGIWKRTVIIFVSDHGMDDTPGFPLNRVMVGDTLTAAGIPESAYEIVGNGSAAHIYLTNRQAAGRFNLLERMRDALRDVPMVSQALYRAPNRSDGGRAHTIAKTAPGWGLGGPRTGDLVITTRPGSAVYETSEINSIPFNPLPGNHGGTTTRDNFWLIAGGYDAIRLQGSKQPITNANAAPTAARLLGVKPPRGAQASWVRDAFFRNRLAPR